MLQCDSNVMHGTKTYYISLITVLIIDSRDEGIPVAYVIMLMFLC